MSDVTKRRILAIFAFLVFGFCALCALKSERMFVWAAEGTTDAQRTVILTFYYEEMKLFQYEQISGTSLDKFPDNAEGNIPLAEDEFLMWKMGSREGALVEYPFVATEDASFYAVIVKKCTLTIRADDGTECVFSYRKGQSPQLIDFPDTMNGYPVLGYFADKDKTQVYDKSAPLDADTTIYASLKMTVEIEVDGETKILPYKSNLSKLEDTNTHRFVGYYTEDGQKFDKALTEDGIRLVTRYERTHYILTLVTEDWTTERFVSVDTNIIEETDFGLPEGVFYCNEEQTETIQFPFKVETDTKLYFVHKIPHSPTIIEYKVAVECEEGEYQLLGDLKVGEMITFSVYNIEPNRKVDAILVSCDGKAVVTMREENSVYFRMPKGNISITVRFADGTANYQKKKPSLSTKEIIAIAVTGGIFASIGVVFLIKYLKKKKKK